jgi:hypothetical protein
MFCLSGYVLRTESNGAKKSTFFSMRCCCTAEIQAHGMQFGVTRLLAPLCPMRLRIMNATTNRSHSSFYYWMKPNGTADCSKMVQLHMATSTTQFWHSSSQPPWSLNPTSSHFMSGAAKNITCALTTPHPGTTSTKQRKMHSNHIPGNTLSCLHTW